MSGNVGQRWATHLTDGAREDGYSGQWQVKPTPQEHDNPTRQARQTPPGYDLPVRSIHLDNATLPSLTRVIEELDARASEMMRGAFADVPNYAAAECFPALNVSEAKGEFTVTAKLPGMTTKDVTVDYCDGVLTIRGETEKEETKQEDDRTYYVWERRVGSFQRSLPFPGGIAEEKIAARFKDGVLTIHLPKVDEANAKHRPITEAPGSAWSSERSSVRSPSV